MKLERNLFFPGHRKIVFSLTGVRVGGVEGGSCGQGEGQRRQEVKVGGSLRGRRRVSTAFTNRQTNRDR